MPGRARLRRPTRLTEPALHEAAGERAPQRRLAERTRLRAVRPGRDGAAGGSRFPGRGAVRPRVLGLRSGEEGQGGKLPDRGDDGVPAGQVRAGHEEHLQATAVQPTGLSQYTIADRNGDSLRSLVPEGRVCLSFQRPDW